MTTTDKIKLNQEYGKFAVGWDSEYPPSTHDDIPTPMQIFHETMTVAYVRRSAALKFAADRSTPQARLFAKEYAEAEYKLTAMKAYDAHMVATDKESLILNLGR